MKQTFCLFLLSTILFQTFVNVGIGVYCHLNKTYIIQQLCENRNNKKLNCNGHCYLSKQLKKAEEGENKSLRFIKEKEEIVSNKISEPKSNSFPGFRVTKLHFFGSHLYSSDNGKMLLKPPTA